MHAVLDQAGVLSRPAQLETAEQGPGQQTRLSRAKKALDALYRKKTNDRASLPSAHVERFIDGHALPTSGAEPDNAQDSGHAGSVSQDRSGPARGLHSGRNTRRDLSTQQQPRFTHAMDPLPNVVVAPETEVPRHEANKLAGLGPFGTQYTRHFEIFPLDPGVLLPRDNAHWEWMHPEGNGDSLCRNTSRASYSSDLPAGRAVLRWGPWGRRHLVRAWNTP